jgi:hypothetical protein
MSGSQTSAARATEGVLDVGDEIGSSRRPRKVQEMGKGESLYANIPAGATDYHNILKGTCIRVEWYENGIWIEPEADQ